MSKLVDAIAVAIARQEKTNPTLNNPGAIMDVQYYKQTGGKFRLQQFATLAEGVTALKKLIRIYIDRGETLSSFFAKYAPTGHGNNNSNSYANNVANWLGISKNIKLSSLEPSYVPPPQLAKQIGAKW